MTLKGHTVDPKQKVPFWLLHRNSAFGPRVRRMIYLRLAGRTDHARTADTLSAGTVKIAEVIKFLGHRRAPAEARQTSEMSRRHLYDN